MKKILLLIIAGCFILRGRCDCADDGLYFWPKKPLIRENPVFSIVGYGNSMEGILELSKKYKVYLVSGKDSVELQVLDIYYGQFSLTQAILKPVASLVPGKTYQLVINGFPYVQYLLKRYNETTEKFENVYWKVETGKDAIPPKWTTLPSYKNDTWIEYGCGPAVSANFSFAAEDESEYLVKATVKSNKTGKEPSYYLNADENLIRIGHGMCSGEFYLENGTTFEVKFGLMDACGNEISWEGAPIKFKKPIPRF